MKSIGNMRSVVSVQLLLLLLIFALLMSEINSENAIGRRSSRRKRYVAFPEGATLSIALCMTAQTILRPSEVFTEGLNWGISYDLPNNTAVLSDFKSFGGFAARRRHRRDLYQKMELIMDSMGYNGKDCIFKALCETGALFNGIRADGLVQEILRIVFGFPTTEISTGEPEEHRHYRDAHIFGQENSDADECTARYSHCTFSIIDLALGYYTQNLRSLYE